MKKTYIISEIGINHNGDLDIAKRLIDISAAAGCDAVKFQKEIQTFVFQNIKSLFYVILLGDR